MCRANAGTAQRLGGYRARTPGDLGLVPLRRGFNSPALVPARAEASVFQRARRESGPPSLPAPPALGTANRSRSVALTPQACRTVTCGWKRTNTTVRERREPPPPSAVRVPAAWYPLHLPEIKPSRRIYSLRTMAFKYSLGAGTINVLFHSISQFSCFELGTRGY